MKYKIWNGTDSLVTPTMSILTKEEINKKYPASSMEGFKFIICDSPVSMGVFMEYETTKNTYIKMGANITEASTPEEVLSAMSAFDDKPSEEEVSSESRIAAALEFQNILALENQGGNE